MSTTTALQIPPYDPELVANVPATMLLPLNNDDDFAAYEAAMPNMTVETIRPLLDQLGLVHEEITVAIPSGGLVISVVRPADVQASAPAMYNIHGGGMILANRFGSFFGDVLSWVAEMGLVVFSPEYTLAGPDARAPQAAEECYAGLKWVMEHAPELSIDPQRMVIAGTSGGGGLAAAVALLARDAGGPSLRGQMLMCPQLDDRHQSISSQHFTLANGATDPWPGESNQYAWDRILGPGHETAEVSIYQAPGRATDLSGLPPAFIDVGSNEVFRDPAIDYASKLFAGGVVAELHVWPGGFHGFDGLVPAAAVSQAAKKAQADWLRRTVAA
ncbi:alpha/beta hydrolase [Microbacterium esteraromaticum]|uniref:alpha/beta hydrolase n=1 Tax=Microbacterium esteraromaticum TaxID=57043 RepID=UPI001CD2D911|nr:alpha/beta hydrolase [Microbacterium esteraromaticum]MCA1307398.1 alpha/beta hydrolase [Microbacterium esteraromaticum]